MYGMLYIYMKITPILQFGVSKIYFLKKLIMYQFPQKYEAAQLFSALIRNVFWAVNQHIRMISEGSCDTEDWSNDAENSALHCRYNTENIFK